jgi:uroporphyrinogen-III synthase
MRALVEKGLEGGIDAFVFRNPLSARTSLGAARKYAPRDEVLGMLARFVVGAIGEQTRKALEESGVRVDAVPESAIFEHRLDAIKECVEKRPICDKSTGGSPPRA